MGSLTTWYRKRGARPFARAGMRAPALFGGARGGQRRSAVVLEGTDWPGWHDGLGDLVDSGSLPFPAARNYGTASVEQWRPLVEQLAGDLPVEFLMAWIAVESGGNPCDKETSTGSDEVAIFQLMAPDNIAKSGFTEAELYPVPPCGSGRVGIDALTAAQANAQVQSGINYVNYCRQYVHAKLDQYHYDWSESELGFWVLVKWVHIAPANIGKILQAGIDSNGGTPPSTYLEMAQAVAGIGLPATWVANGNSVGQYGAGGGSMLGLLRDPVTLLAIGAFVVGTYYIWKKVG